MIAPWMCEVYVESLDNSVGPPLTSVLSQLQRVSDVFSKLPTCEREENNANISHLHKNLSHVSPSGMAEMLKRGAHQLILRAARAHHCPNCVQHSRHPPRPVAATQLHAPMRCLERDDFEWQHPRTKQMSRGICAICCFTCRLLRQGD